MSRLFLASEPSLGRQVVIKVLPPESGSEVSVARFRREIELAARLQHPNILGVLTAGIDGDLVWYAMPYVEGESLRHRLERTGAFPITVATRLLREVADALAYAHGRGVIHRDVKPENILLAADHALLADFGIAHALAASRGDARLTASGLSLGTPGYMAPEQLAGAPVDQRADVYALGLVGWEMIVGEPPFTGRDAQAVLVAQLTQPAPALHERRRETPPFLVSAIDSALAKDPGARLGSAAFRDALELPLPSSAEPTHKPVAAIRKPAVSRTVLLVGAIAALLAAGLALKNLFMAPATPSVGVLPFVNGSDSAAHEYFSDGVTEELITALGQIEALRVVARTSAFAFKGKHVDIREIGERLGVDMLVEGSVRRQQNRVRIDARLIRVDDRFVLWTETYDRAAEDVFAAQEDIAQRIAGALRVKLRQGADSIPHHTRTDLIAHDAYLKGRYALATGDRDGLEQATRYFEQALARQPSFAEAHAGLAESYAQLGNTGHVRHSEAHPRARLAAEQALSLDPNVAEAHTALGYVRASERDFKGAEASFRRALALQPSHAAAHHLLGYMLVTLDRGSEGIAELRIAKRLDPLATRIGTALGRALIYVGAHDAALAEFRELLKMEPRHPSLLFGMALAHEQAERSDSAIAAAQQALSVASGHAGAMGVLGVVYAKNGNQSKAREIVRSLERNASGSSAFYIASVLAALGDSRAALDWLDRLWADEPSWLISMQVEPWLDPLRSEARFADLQRRMGFGRA